MAPISFAFAMPSIMITADILSGRTSLGGSESACIGLAQALARRGNGVDVFTTELDNALPPVDEYGVRWHRLADLAAAQDQSAVDVFVSLKYWSVFKHPIRARWRVLWNQEFVDRQLRDRVLEVLPVIDAAAYVSHVQRMWWEEILPELAPIGWVTRNGYAIAHVPANIKKDPDKIVYISRPERALTPILEMWPEVRRGNPCARLHICRYRSLYDSQEWIRTLCRKFDDAVSRVNLQVGGIVYLGELGKQELYREIAESAVMWYPGVISIPETSCIAALEAQACGTPLVATLTGALPETAPYATLIPGNPETDADYRQASVAAVLRSLDDCRSMNRRYLNAQLVGRVNARRSTHDVIAVEWEAYALECLNVLAHDSMSRIGVPGWRSDVSV